MYFLKIRWLPKVVFSTFYLKRQVIGFFDPSHSYSPVETLFLLRPHHPHEQEFRESNIPAHTSPWNVAAGIVHRTVSREWVIVIMAVVPEIPCGKGLVEFQLYGFLMFIS